jgi:PAS domain-containing protein
LVEQHRALAENSPDLIVRFDRELKHVYVNSSAAQVGKLNAEEALRVPRSVRDFFKSFVGPWQGEHE